MLRQLHLKNLEMKQLWGGIMDIPNIAGILVRPVFLSSQSTPVKSEQGRKKKKLVIYFSSKDLVEIYGLLDFNN